MELEEALSMYNRFNGEISDFIQGIAKLKTEAELDENDEFPSVAEITEQLDTLIEKARNLAVFLPE